jgi:tRNA pseudouridine synthase 10
LVDSARSALVQLKQYELCTYCLSRQAGAARKKRVQKCHICRGLFDRLDEIAEKALDAMRQYEFATFLVGATLATQFFEREDALRARLKIRGKESIKSQLTRELGQRLARMTNKRVDFARPDLAVNLVIDKDGSVEARARARPLALQGRYVKKTRGLPQKQERCPMCQGKGCNLCDNTGFYGDNSIEGILAKHIAKATGGQSPRFSWVGSEDQNSLVLGKGRTFYAKVSDPRVRKPKKRWFSEAGVTCTITGVLEDVPDTQARFVVRTRIACTCDRPVTNDDIAKLKSLAGAEVKFESRSKVALKKIHSAQAKKTGDGEFALTIKADGGLPIKQFVGGQEYMEPNVSGLLGAKCECATFDVLSVQIQ